MAKRPSKPSISSVLPETSHPQPAATGGDPASLQFRAHVIQDVLASEYKFVTSIEQFLKLMASPLRALPSMPSKAKRALLGHLFRVVQACV